MRQPSNPAVENFSHKLDEQQLRKYLAIAERLNFSECPHVCQVSGCLPKVPVRVGGRGSICDYNVLVEKYNSREYREIIMHSNWALVEFQDEQGMALRILEASVPAPDVIDCINKFVFDVVRAAAEKVKPLGDALRKQIQEYRSDNAEKTRVFGEINRAMCEPNFSIDVLNAIIMRADRVSLFEKSRVLRLFDQSSAEALIGRLYQQLGVRVNMDDIKSGSPPVAELYELWLFCGIGNSNLRLTKEALGSYFPHVANPPGGVLAIK